MGYCPKCDMEFVEGVTVCSDCGGPLVESEEVWKEMVKKQQAEQLQKQAEVMREQAAALQQEAEAAAQAPKAAAPRAVRSGVYVTSREKCEDRKSSGAALIGIGGLLTVFSLVCFAGIIRLPVAQMSRLLLQTVGLIMGIGFLIGGIRTRKAAASYAEKAEAEEKQTAEIRAWFLGTWDAEALDREIHAADPSAAGPELDFKRMELITDHLITGRDLPDPAYADYLAEDLYTAIYPEL